MLRDGVHVAGVDALRYRSIRRAVAALHSASGRFADGDWNRHRAPGSDFETRVRSDDRAEMGDGVRRVRFDRRILRQLRDLARNRQDHSGGCVRSRMSATARGRARRADGAAAEDPGPETEADGAQRKTSRGLTTNRSHTRIRWNGY